MDVEGASGAEEDGQQGIQGRGSQEPLPGRGPGTAQQTVSSKRNAQQARHAGAFILVVLVLGGHQAQLS